jgi:hypothetical protein
MAQRMCSVGDHEVAGLPHSAEARPNGSGQVEGLEAVRDGLLVRKPAKDRAGDVSSAGLLCQWRFPRDVRRVWEEVLAGLGRG